MYASMHAKESANCSETIFVQLIKINFDAIDIDDFFFDSIEKENLIRKIPTIYYIVQVLAVKLAFDSLKSDNTSRGESGFSKYQHKTTI